MAKPKDKDKETKTKVKRVPRRRLPTDERTISAAMVAAQGRYPGQDQGGFDQDQGGFDQDSYLGQGGTGQGSYPGQGGPGQGQGGFGQGQGGYLGQGGGAGAKRFSPKAALKRNVVNKDWT